MKKLIPLLLLAFIACKSTQVGLSDHFVYQVDLSEMTAKEASAIDLNFKPISINQSKNSIVVSRTDMESYMKIFIKFGILNPGVKQFSFYRPLNYPRMSYWEYMINQLPEFVNYGYKYDSYSEQMDKKSQLFAFLAYRIKRTPKHLKDLFDQYSKVIYTAIPKELYKSSQLDKYVDALIKVHDHLKVMPDLEKKWLEIGAVVAKQDRNKKIFGRTASQYSIYQSILHPEVNKTFTKRKTDVLWFHSFWLRRHQENNTAAVYGILKKIQMHYNK